MQIYIIIKHSFLTILHAKYALSRTLCAADPPFMYILGKKFTTNIHVGVHVSHCLEGNVFSIGNMLAG